MLFVLYPMFIYILFHLYKIDLYESIYYSLFLLLTLYFLVYLVLNPTIALIPYNMFIEYSYDKKVFYTEEEKRKIFPTSVLLEKYWYQIKQEYLSLKFLSTIPPTVPSTDEILKRQDYKNIGEKFISESKEFWKGWNTLELISFGHINNKNLDKCPLLKE